MFIDENSEHGVRVEFDEPQRAVTPGQSVVFYSDEVCLGGVLFTIQTPLHQILFKGMNGMVELPFQQSQALNVRQNRALALAGVFQATQLTHMTAMTGQQSIGESGNFYFELLIKASLNIRLQQIIMLFRRWIFLIKWLIFRWVLKLLKIVSLSLLPMRLNLVCLKCVVQNFLCLMRCHFCS